TSSTLLEGMNLPVDKMFVLDNKKGNKKLSPSQFKNLVGRVSRFSEIFSDEEELLGLEPHIYLVISEYFSKNANVEKFLEDSMKEDKKIKDDPGNVLLENVSITEENKNEKVKADEFIENFEKGIVTNYEKPYAKTTVGEYCFLNNIREIDILENEQAIQYKINQRRIEKVDNVESVFKLFADLFLPFVNDNQKNLKRLRNKEAQRFYQMFLNWRIENTSFSEMISKFLDYWEKVEQEDESLVFVGRWGDEQRGGFEKLWTNIKLKSQKERINLAIVRIKEEQDFLDNVIIKFIEVLNDLEMLDSEFYLKIKYGTSNDDKIMLLKNGLSLHLANLIRKKYSEYIELNKELHTVDINPIIIKRMKENNENGILMNELSMNIKFHN